MAAPKSKDALRPLRQVSETARERETFKYKNSIPSTTTFNDSGCALAGVELRTSGDTVLTALAQLGACQTKSARALVSIFDTNYQYIIAEATPDMVLGVSLDSEACGEALWFCGTAIPRKHGVCEATLLGQALEREYETVEATGQLPVLVVPDLTADPRFKHKPYCAADGPARFHAGVPIRTKRGINIGVYCIMDPEPGRPWSDADSARLRSISRALMEHFETQRSRDLHRRTERMNRGLGCLVEGRATLSGWDLLSDAASFADRAGNEGTLNAQQQSLQKEDVTTGRQAVDHHLPTTPSSFHRPHAPGQRYDLSLQRGPDSHSRADAEQVGIGSSRALPRRGTVVPPPPYHSSGGVFSRAANIIRESLEVEGCLFYDSTLNSYRTPSKSNARKHGLGVRVSETSSSSEELPTRDWPPAELLGHSTSGSSSVDGSSTNDATCVLAERFLRKLLRRYPRGKIFNFDAHGELQSSDSSEEEVPPSPPQLRQQEILARTPSSSDPPSHPVRQDPWTRNQEGSRIYELFPGARSVAFFPIWDPKKERWRAGGFVYTNDRTRHFTVNSDLSYLRVFGMTAAAEILRLNILLEDQAKSDVLGSLSHELRSPLHGALLSAELLNDTKLDVFQGNLAHTVDTCCRTLLDTLDHLLDFSTVNSFTGRDDESATGSQDSKNFVQKSLRSQVMLDELFEEVIESIYAGFVFQHQSIRQAANRDRRGVDSDVAANRFLDSMQAAEQLKSPATEIQEPQLDIGHVAIFLSIEPHIAWLYEVQVGAVRRIVMNLFGNALKYTSSGSVSVSLTQELASIKRRKRELVVKIVVRDTGKGISPEYLRDNLYTAFSQEDSLSPGAGLGLSLTKRITAELGGQISISSRVGQGTVATVLLPLREISKIANGRQALVSADDGALFAQRLEDLRGLRIRIVYSDPLSERNTSEGQQNLETLCRDWLRMEVITDAEEEQKAPDVKLWSESALPSIAESADALAKTANVVICADAVTAYHRSMALESANYPGIIELISQPTGPRKLAQTLLLAIERWADMPKPSPRGSIPSLAANVRPPGPSRSPSFADVLTPPASSNATGSSQKGLEPLETTKPEGGRETQPPVTLALRPSVDGMAHQADPSVGVPAAGVRKTFLLVDDNSVNLRILEAYMHKLNIEYVAVTNGEEAVRAFGAKPPIYRCVLMDISMPVMNGFEATRRIRALEAQENLGHVTIVALSGLASNDAQQEAFGSGMDMFLTKPVKLKALGDLLTQQGVLDG